MYMPTAAPPRSNTGNHTPPPPVGEQVKPPGEAAPGTPKAGEARTAAFPAMRKNTVPARMRQSGTVFPRHGVSITKRATPPPNGVFKPNRVSPHPAHARNNAPLATTSATSVSSPATPSLPALKTGTHDTTRPHRGFKYRCRVIAGVPADGAILFTAGEYAPIHGLRMIRRNMSLFPDARRDSGSQEDRRCNWNWPRFP